MQNAKNIGRGVERSADPSVTDVTYKRIESGPEEGPLWAFFDLYSLCPEVGKDFLLLERDSDGETTGRSLLCHCIELQCSENTGGWDSIAGRKGDDPIVGIVFSIHEN